MHCSNFATSFQRYCLLHVAKVRAGAMVPSCSAAGSRWNSSNQGFHIGAPCHAPFTGRQLQKCNRAIGSRRQSQAMQRWAVAEALAHIRSGLEDCQNLAKDDPAGGGSPGAGSAGTARDTLNCRYQLVKSRASSASMRTLMKLCQAISSEDAEFELQRAFTIFICCEASWERQIKQLTGYWLLPAPLGIMTGVIRCFW